MKTFFAIAVILAAITTSASAQTIMNGCEMEPVPNTGGTLMQRVDPTCNGFRINPELAPGIIVGNERFTVTEIIEDVLARGAWDGSSQDRFRITTMGVAESNGANVVRVRNPDGRAIEVRIGNNPPVIETAGQGEAFFEVPAGGGYAVYDDATGERLHGTASTNSNPFDDVTEVEVETEFEGGSKE